MGKSCVTEAQVIGLTEEQEAGMATAEVFYNLGLSQGKFYKFKSR